MLVFEKRGKPEYPEKNLSVQSIDPANSTHSTPPRLVIEPGPHRWEASALTTTPSLHVGVGEDKLPPFSFSPLSFCSSTSFSHDHITATRATLALNGIVVITFELAGDISFV